MHLCSVFISSSLLYHTVKVVRWRQCRVLESQLWEQETNPVHWSTKQKWNRNIGLPSTSKMCPCVCVCCFTARGHVCEPKMPIYSLCWLFVSQWNHMDGLLYQLIHTDMNLGVDWQARYWGPGCSKDVVFLSQILVKTEGSCYFHCREST